MPDNAPFLSGNVRFFTQAEDALAYAMEIYAANLAYLQEEFGRFARGEILPQKVEAYYPYVAVETRHPTQVDTRLSYGFVAGPGRYSTTLTRPDIFARYYLEQFQQILKNHQVGLEVGASQVPIPIHYAFQSTAHIEGGLTAEQISLLHELFTVPDLRDVDDSIANGTWQEKPGQDRPLALFTAPRVDYSLQRLRHYTGTDPSIFQNFVIFTNYQFYVDEFVRLGRERVAQTDSGYTDLVQPVSLVTGNGASLPQMPAYHLVRADGSGITMINMGVGPSNARTITDHVAVLRPDAWIMLGHCAGLRKTQRLGDYVLAHAYVRDDHVLDDELPIWVPIPALSEVQRSFETAVARVTEKGGYDVKSVMRTGTVVSTDNRNWEISGYTRLAERFSQSRAIAMDMESAVVAANGFRFRVPYGTLLCVSDRPLHGEIKLPGMATDFYRTQVNQHLTIGILAIELLRQNGLEPLHSRKLRSYTETAFK